MNDMTAKYATVTAAMMASLVSMMSPAKKKWSCAKVRSAAAGLSIVVADSGRVAAQRHQLDLHVREQRQPGQQRVQLVDAVDVEHADVGVLAGDAPQVAPLAAFLQPLRHGLLGRLQCRGLIFRHRHRQADIHSYVK